MGADTPTGTFPRMSHHERVRAAIRRQRLSERDRRVGGITGYFGLNSIGRLWLPRKDYMSCKCLGHRSVRPWTCPVSQHTNGRCGLAGAVSPPMLLIAFGCATFDIVSACSAGDVRK
jgi:hypothetical protein